MLDDRALTIEDEGIEEMSRVTLGCDLFGRLLVVAYSRRGEEIRLISARKAMAGESRQYGARHE